jgi:hypothetical protein
MFFHGKAPAEKQEVNEDSRRAAYPRLKRLLFGPLAVGGSNGLLVRVESPARGDLREWSGKGLYLIDP